MHTSENVFVGKGLDQSGFYKTDFCVGDQITVTYNRSAPETAALVAGYRLSTRYELIPCLLCLLFGIGCASSLVVRLFANHNKPDETLSQGQADLHDMAD